MRALSLWQPWASLWVSGRKRHETRHWPTSYRGPLLVHAAQRFERNDLGADLETLLADEFGAAWARTLPTGALVGVVDLTACVRTESLAALAPDDRVCGDFTAGRWAWRGDHPQHLAPPIPWRGRQGLFEIPDEFVWGAAVRRP